MLAHAIRFLTVDAVEKAQSGHPGMPLGMADVATVLFQKHLRFYAPEPSWKYRDKLILSCGHGCMLLYSIFYLTGYPGMTIDNIENFRKIDSPCSGHPEYEVPGVETTTGPLGQGLAHAVGMAISDQKSGLDKKRKIFVILSDGDLMEGIVYESFSLVKELRLSNLIFLYDDNGITIDGETTVGDRVEKLMAYFGIESHEVDGHDYQAIDAILAKVKASQTSQFVVCKTIIGWGAGVNAGTYKIHSNPIGKEAIAEMRKRLNWTYSPFEIPENLLNQWRAIGVQYKDEFLKQPECDGDFQPALSSQPVVFKKDITSTREAFGEVIAGYDVLGGSCDLAGSTYANRVKAENYIPFGVREHAMAASLNGIVLSKCYRAFGTTFFAFSDYMRPSIRLAALMKIPTVFIFTHDSIGVGEDGPTHQPCEHLSSLRAIPHLNVFRPCDAYETEQCIKAAFNETNKPSVIVLSRQALPVLKEFPKFSDDLVDIVFIATGSEVHIALAVAEELKKEKSVRVVSVPCLETFENFDLFNGKKRVIIEAGARMSWGKFLREGDLFFGVEDFGVSGSAKDAFDYFGLTKEKILEKVRESLAKT